MNAYRVNITFSPNGQYFALFRKALNILQIYQIDNGDISGMMDKIQDDQDGQDE
jgi:hypothetical protein